MYLQITNEHEVHRNTGRMLKKYVKINNKIIFKIVFNMANIVSEAAGKKTSYVNHNTVFLYDLWERPDVYHSQFRAWDS